MTPRHAAPRRDDASDANDEFFELFGQPQNESSLLPHQSQVERQARRKRRLRRTIVTLVVLALVIGGGAFAVNWAWNEYGDRISERFGWTDTDYEGEGHGEVVITISSGEIGADVAETLEEAGVVMTSKAFYELLLRQPTEFHPGSYRLKLEMSAEAALAALTDPENRLEFIATIPEGRTVAQTLETLAIGAEIPLEELQAAAQDVAQFGLPEGVTSLEGWLFPATYEFEPTTTATDAIMQMVNAQKNVLDGLGVPEVDRQRILTIAAIVEREAGRHQDFARVARVIYNRLDQGMKLEMDSTAQYGFGQRADGIVWSTDEELSDDNAWNTYVHTGLPVGPIANPGRAAIEAALNPAEGDWLFFVAVNLDTGESVFSDDLAGHQAAESQLRNWCADNPGRGC